ncbi:hypothetical protein CBR_g49548 [Chara braunii]|uniref:Uncharacterized protein n=1 Tax=Chara braunii TaxID=69332 RepID=A0A388M5B2_CHABU|nr:hypothetical protein CBR_g49548 [Chara braunii]|eukprot:GBG89695.1 hypothetical protein CBR_g49548 [Chara braunii]
MVLSCLVSMEQDRAAAGLQWRNVMGQTWREEDGSRQGKKNKGFLPLFAKCGNIEFALEGKVWQDALPIFTIGGWWNEAPCGESSECQGGTAVVQFRLQAGVMVDRHGSTSTP